MKSSELNYRNTFMKHHGIKPDIEFLNALQHVQDMYYEVVSYQALVIYPIQCAPKVQALYPHISHYGWDFFRQKRPHF